MAGVPVISTNRSSPAPAPQADSPPKTEKKDAPPSAPAVLPAVRPPFKSALTPELQRLRLGGPWRENSREAKAGAERIREQSSSAREAHSSSDAGQPRAEHEDRRAEQTSTSADQPRTERERTALDLERAQKQLGAQSERARELEAQIRANTDPDRADELTAEHRNALAQTKRLTAEAERGRARLNYLAATETKPEPGKTATSSVAAGDSNQPAQPEEPSTASRALGVIGDSAQIVGGVALIVGGGPLGWAAGGAIVLDGVGRLAHHIVDWRNGATTDSYQSQLMQYGLSRDTANRADVALNMALTLPATMGGLRYVFKWGGTLFKTAAVTGGTLAADTIQSSGRYVVTGEQVRPFTVSALMNAGYTETQANYAVMAGNILTTVGMVKGAASRTTAASHFNIREFDRSGAPILTGADARTQAAAHPPGATANGAAATSKAFKPPGSPVRTSDFYESNAPEYVRRQTARLLGEHVDPEALRNRSIVTVNDPFTGEIYAASVIKQNAAGRDAWRNRIEPRSAIVEHVGGDSLGMRQALSASEKAIEQFTTQHRLVYTTTHPPDAEFMNAARSQVQLLRESSAVTDRQLLALDKVPFESRGNLNDGTHRVSYTATFDRPLTAFGSPMLGWVAKPMDSRSALGMFNRLINPMKNAVALHNYVKRAHTEFQPAETFAPPPKLKDALPRDAYVYSRGILSESQYAAQVEGVITANAPLGDIVNFNRMSPHERVPHFTRELQGLDVVRVVEKPQGGGDVLVGGAAIKRDFRGYQNVAFERERFGALASEQHPPRTAYLSHVFGPGGGGMLGTVAAINHARKIGQRSVVFVTQGEQAQNMYAKLGGRSHAGAEAGGQNIEGLRITSAEFGPYAGRSILRAIDAGAPLEPQLNRFPAEIRSVVKEAIETRGNQPDEMVAQRIQSQLPKSKEMDDWVGKLPNGVLFVKYQVDFKPKSTLQSLQWKAADAADYAKVFARNAVDQGIVQPLSKGVSTMMSYKPAMVDRFITAAGDLHLKVNPYALPTTIEPRPLHASWHNAVHTVVDTGRAGWEIAKGTLVFTAAAQAVTGNVNFYSNNDRATRIFNGVPGSKSIAVQFPLTGTTIAAWTAGPNVRGPYPLDETGLMPLASLSRGLSDPNGPMSVNGLTAARAVLGEANLGIRWFGTNNISAISAYSVRLLPVNGNLRASVPIQRGGTPPNASLVSSITGIMPSASHAVYWGRTGLVVRKLHVTLSGGAQTNVVSTAQRAAAMRSGQHWTAPSNDITTGQGVFLGGNAAYGTPELTDP